MAKEEIQCGWRADRTLEKDCNDCCNKRCHACKKNAEGGSYVCDSCYSKMDIQQLEE